MKRDHPGKGRLRVLSISGATLPPLGADTWIHALILGALDRSTHALHAACVAGPASAPTPTYLILSRIPDLRVRTVRFGREVSARSRFSKLGAVLDAPRALMSLIGLVAYVRRNHIEIIHTSDRPRDALAAVIIARLSRTKCIVHSHVAFGEWMGAALRWSLKRGDALVAVSAFVARSLVASGHDPARIHVVLNAIDPGEWSPGKDRESARRELGVPTSSPVLLSVSRLFREKGLAELLEAVASIRALVPDVRVVIAGSDVTPGHSFSKELQSIIQQRGLEENVIFTGYRSDVARLMAAADVFAMPSFEEPFGLVYAEAMAMKLPVVGLDSGGVPEIVEHGVTGLLSNPGDISTLATNLLRLINNRDLRLKMGEAGRRVVEERFTPSRLAGDMAKVYALLAERQPVTQPG